jgi:type II secretory pathway predicted ATPase ExeA
MIEAYYNFKKKPFSKNIETKNIFQSESIKELNRRLNHMKEIRGIMLLTGLSGVGKTLSLRTFVSELNPNIYKVFYIPLATVHVLDFYKQLSMELAGQTYWKKSQLYAAIQNAIIDYVKNQKKLPIIIFDEIHYFKNENFYELQMITNFEMDSEDPAVFILIGQPHVEDRLRRPVHQSFNQRITLKYNLTPLSNYDTKSYIEHHFGIAGRKAEIFSENAINAIHQNSQGIPRIINSICLKALMIGCLEKKEMITEEEIYRTTSEI